MSSNTVKERPILFSAPMVIAILGGSKTQTRRVVKNPDKAIAGCDISGLIDQPNVLAGYCPYGKPGDQLWVRESWQVLVVDHHNLHVGYGATECTKSVDREMLTGEQDEQVARFEKKSGFVPSIHMPRWASRIQLEITNVRVERLNEISNADIRAEGACKRSSVTHLLDFQHLWESINGADSWSANPWVWVVEFKRVGGAS